MNTKLALVIGTLPFVAATALATASGQALQAVGERVPLPAPAPVCPVTERESDPLEFDAIRAADREYLDRSSVVLAGDVNGDGCGDFALSNRNRQTDCSLNSDGPTLPDLDRVWIVSGKDGALLRTLWPPREPVDPFGRVIENVGDLDLDEVPDLVVASGDRAWAYSGADGSVVHEFGGWFGRSGYIQNLAGGGDLDGDGAADVALFVQRNLASSDAGRNHFVAVHSGATGRLVRLVSASDWMSQHAFTRGVATSLLEAKSISRTMTVLSDQNGDGRDELVVEIVPRDCAEAVLVVLDVAAGVELRRVKLERTLPSAAQILRSMPDVNSDGMADYALSAVNTWVAVHCGRLGTELRRHSYGKGTIDGEGTSLCVTDDLDGDEVADYLMAAHENFLDCDPGFVVLYSGASGRVLRTSRRHTTGLSEKQRISWSNPVAGVDACALSDVDRDGKSDIVMSMPRIGEVWMLSGISFEPIWRAPLFERFIAADAEAER